MNIYIIILIALLLSAFFSGMEIAFLTSNKLKIELDKKNHKISSKVISVFANNPSQYISTMLFGNNIALVIYGIFMAKLLQPWLQHFISSEGWLLIVVTLLSTLIILFFAEFLPKTLFRISPNFILSLFYLPLFLFYLLFYPITRFTIIISKTLFRWFFNIKSFPSNNYTFGKVNLNALINLNKPETSSAEYIDQEIRFVKNVLDFTEAKIRDCMIPRKEIVAVEVTSSVDLVKRKFIETRYSKILVYKSTIDNIIGYISSKELFKNPKTIKSKLVKCLIVPETMSAIKLLNMFMAKNKSMAVVVDEFGGTSGIVTIEDIIEEIFGEIEDEHDVTDLEERVINENEFIFSGRLEIDYLNDKYNLKLPESEEYDTLAGLVLSHYQSLPEVNQKIYIGNFEFTILKVSRTKLELVDLKIPD